MARQEVDYSGLRYDAITLEIDDSTITYDKTQVSGSAQVGLAVTLSADDTVKLTEDGEFVLGKLLAVEEDGFCTVQNKGFVTLPAGSGATITRGKQVVGDLGASSAKGYVRDADTAVAAELGVMNGRVINEADQTAVVIDLG